MTDPRTRARELARSLIAWRQALAAPLPPIADSIYCQLTIAPGEMWCRHCGAEGTVNHAGLPGPQHAMCIYCGSRDLVPAAQILRPGEYAYVS